jgi:formylglycine-generating enzyme required for sulfatase activity
MKLLLLIYFLLFSNAFAALKKLPSHIIVKNDKYYSKIDGMELIYIPAGSFTMGSNSGNPDEKPEHIVNLSHFFIDKYEVSNAQFEKFLRKTRYRPQGPWRRGYKNRAAKNYPVIFITWNDAKAYAKWVKRDLPTEAQWEYAARGKNSNKYPWGDDWNPKNLPNNKLVAVNKFKNSKSPFGVNLMAGNVWEWVRDWYDRHYYKSLAKEVSNPLGPKDNAPPEQRFIDNNTAAGNERSTLKVIKGGSSFGHMTKDTARGSKRIWGNPGYWFNDTGFRCGFSL